MWVGRQREGLDARGWSNCKQPVIEFTLELHRKG